VTTIHDRPASALPPELLYEILRLRSEVFVVEQAAAYLDLDGRDLEPGTRQLWIEADGVVVATARVLDDGAARRIGRIATAPAHRRRGLAAALVEHFVATTDGPWRLDAQAHLAAWYERLGFVVDGDEYDDGDGIRHVPMIRAATGS
jgi:ElaA protein